MRGSHVLGLLVLSMSACADARPEDTGAGWALELTQQESWTEALLQAVSPVDADVVWVSGHQATYVRTLDGGDIWIAATVPGATGLQFRDVAAFDAETAYLMSAGEGEESRIYRTDDGGTTWALQYTADHPSAFLDCMDFWTPDRGLVYGDAVDGVPFILETDDGGATWSRVPSAGLPPALEGEGGFAASGTCLVTGENGSAWIATGNGERPRVLVTADYGQSWRAIDVPVVRGPASGLTTIQMGRSDGVALGGVIGQDSVRSENVTVTRDGGLTWEPGGPLVMDGPVYGSAFAAELALGNAYVAVGPRGLDWTVDGGVTWRSVDTQRYWAVGFASPDAGWAVGPTGRITKLRLVRR